MAVSGWEHRKAARAARGAAPTSIQADASLPEAELKTQRGAALGDRMIGWGIFWLEGGRT